ncbi:2OG-Fe dioxygenase family protein [Caenimonas aquaedulcis]|uniref:2OG-Fe dioxygenase family protein n=1 Tax=Caenimonas aquaedulcis TaxID=2793270 RepID=A0A931MJI6_9BURK|nr:2OG-Fe dioxygenase family protein [Caenimonas aquaedulcis]MBG9390335.1 2OG-Fe dioxygenase family protein [Caenimonas aquaedulcis]
MILTPAYTYPDQVPVLLRQQGYAMLSPSAVAHLAGCDLAQLMALRPSWDRLASDNYLKDGGHYRKRRHSCFVVDGDAVTQAPHRAHWQPVEYNALHGGMERWFEPMEPQVVAAPAWHGLLRALARISSTLKGNTPWFVEAHQFRIDTEGGIGRPTPEGAHRDGVDLVAVFLVARENIKGGETRVFEAQGPAGQRFTLTEPWSLLLLDDERVIHESTPIQPVGEQAHRDTLVITLRAGGFQGA